MTLRPNRDGSMAWFRLFMRDKNKRIVGRSDFDADTTLSGLKIAYQISLSCSDVCASYELLEDGKLVSRPDGADGRGSLRTAFLEELEQQIATTEEIALRDGIWAIGKSKRLRATLVEAYATSEIGPKSNVVSLR